MENIAVVVSNANDKITPFQTIDSIIEAGFKSVFIQWYDKEVFPSQNDQLKYIRKKNINVIFAHLGYKGINSIWVDGLDGELLVEQYKRNIKECKDNNINLVVMHLTNKSEAPKYNELGLNRLKDIVEYAKELAVKVAFENTKIKGYIEYVLENIKNENVGFCFDSGHYHVHFNDEFNFDLVKNRMFAIHLHDNDQSEDQHLYPFEGTLDWEFIINKLKYCNYKGPITLELCYRNRYLNMNPSQFYKKGYQIGKKIDKMLNS